MYRNENKIKMLKSKRGWKIKGKRRGKKEKEKPQLECAFIKCMRGNYKNELLATKKRLTRNNDKKMLHVKEGAQENNTSTWNFQSDNLFVTNTRPQALILTLAHPLPLRIN